MRLELGIGPGTAALAVLLLAAGAAGAQDLQGTADVDVARANFRASCSLDAGVAASLTRGETVEVLGTQGRWLRVRHPDSGIEGCMHESVLGPVQPAAVEEPPPPAPVEEETVEIPFSEPVEDRSSRSPGERRLQWYLGLDVGYTARNQSQLSTSGGLGRFDQSGRVVAIPNSFYADEYEFGDGMDLSVGADVLWHLPSGGALGGGLRISRQTYDADVEIYAEWPHPSVPSVIVGDSIRGSLGDGVETALHLHAVYSPPTPPDLVVRIFLGPTLFRVEVPRWVDILPEYSLGPPRLRWVSFGTAFLEEDVVGGHAGADVSYFFSEVFGVGGSLIYSTASETFEYARFADRGSLTADVEFGGATASFGVRIRF